MADDLTNERYSKETKLIYGKSYSMKWDYDHHVVPPITSSATYRLDSAKRGAQGFLEFANTTEESKRKQPIWIYDRLGEPNKDMLEETLAYAEGGECAVTFGCGMAAISAVLGVLTKTGDEIIAHRTMYGCTFSLLRNWYPRYNIGVQLLNLHDVDALESAINEKTRVIYFETPVNPTLTLIDIAAVTKLVKKVNLGRPEEAKLYVVVDNTFSTPYCQRPIEHGADFVVHSLTKGIGGFGTDMGGVVVGPEKWLDWLLLYRKDFGGVLSPKAAWPVQVYGLPTLSLRVRRQIETSMIVAEFLETHPKVRSVSYPGLPSFPQYELARRQMTNYEGEFTPGTLMYFTLKSDSPQESRDKGERLIDHVAERAYAITLAVSLGHTRTLIEHPGSMTHSAIPAEEQVQRGMDPGGIRLSIGIERPEDIIQDLEEALAQV
ncbi:MAG TPA: aminotransferase class I/II-fold pyridoxal phosphate-dependent enzyme [Bacteroidota bacterium]|nr:aminotransferase class I/II-fold pyridoxal phosphate-dependent enzyme [Bacteroidota bacterium]